MCNVALGKLNEHQSRVCRDLCLRCFNPGHSSKECSLPTAGTCPRCYLPTSIGNQYFHLNGFEMCTNNHVPKLFGLSFLNFAKRREANHHEQWS